jgi:hypothetical protein
MTKIDRTVVGLGTFCLVVAYLVLPMLIGSPEPLLSMTLTGSTCATCMYESYWVVETQNLGPWPVRIRVWGWGTDPPMDWQGKPVRDFTLMPFGKHVERYVLTSYGGMFGNPLYPFYGRLCFLISANATFMSVYRTFDVSLSSCATLSRESGT